MYQVGDRVRITKCIWDDGQDHHPPGEIARMGEIVTVHDVRANSLLCNHDWVTDGRTFIAMLDEVEPLKDSANA